MACRSSQVMDRPCYSSQVSNGPCYSLDKSGLQLSVTALFYLEDSRKIHLRGVRARRSKDTRRRAPQRAGERELALAPLFICLSLPGPALCKLGQPGVLFVLPEVLTPGPRTFFCFIFAGFSLPCLVATTILDSFSLFYLPNRMIVSPVFEPFLSAFTY